MGKYKVWKKWLKVAGVQKFKINHAYDEKTSSWREIELKEPSDTYYATDNQFDIEKPLKGETLLDFILRLARSVEDTGEGHRLQWRA